MQNLLISLGSAFMTVFNTFSWRDGVDILIVAYLIYTVINLLIHTRTGLLIKGAVVLLAAYFLSTSSSLSITCSGTDSSSWSSSSSRSFGRFWNGSGARNWDVPCSSAD